MRNLLTTTALALAVSGYALGAIAQEGTSTTNQTTAGSGSMSMSCETPWGTVDANADGSVSRDEASQHIDASFGALDADGNGEVSRSEYRDCLGKAASDVTDWPERTDEEFSEIDTNKDSNIGSDEFRDASRSAFEAAEGSDSPENRMVISRYILLTPEELGNRDLSADEAAGRAAYTFQSLDRNGDDMVSMEEWKDRQSASGMNEARADRRFDNLDADSSDGISREEYSASWQGASDAMTTSGIGSASSGSGASGSATTGTDATGQSGSSTQGSGDGDASSSIPVFIYRFETF